MFPHIFLSEDKKPPKGFEKFFKKKEEREATSKTGKSNWPYFLLEFTYLLNQPIFLDSKDEDNKPKAASKQTD